MDYISSNEAAQKWDVGLRRVQYFCSHGMVAGARRMGRQWIIPADADRPIDGRTRLGRSHQAEGYHFPVFTFTPCYADPTDLNESERQLLQAQILRLEGKFAKSIELCQDILSGYVPPYLAAGVHLTIGYDSLLLGIASGYRRALAELDRILDAETHHAEDVRLMRASLSGCGSLDCAPTFAIDPSKLSNEAIVYYKYCLLSAFVPTGEASGKIPFRYFRSDLARLERDGITPALYSLHSLLGCMVSQDNSMQDRESNMRTAAQLAVENNWIGNLCRYYNASSALIEKCLKPYGDRYVTELRKAYQATMKGWQVAHALENGNDETSLFSSGQIELLLLVSRRYSTKTIAAVECMTTAEVESALAEIYAIAGVDTKADLAKYADKILFPS